MTDKLFQEITASQCGCVMMLVKHGDGLLSHHIASVALVKANKTVN